MQNTKERIVSYELAKRISPRACPKPKTIGTETQSPSPSAPARKTPIKDKSKKGLNNHSLSPRTGASEKKRPSRISELESQVSQLQEELKKAKDQLGTFESQTNQCCSYCVPDSQQKRLQQSESEPAESEAKAGASLREKELETELKKRISEIEELKADLMDKETEFQCVLDENESLQAKLEKKNFPNMREIELENELKKVKEAVSGFKAKLMDKETELQNISEENENLRLEISKTDRYRTKNSRIKNEKSGPLDVSYDAFCGKLRSFRVEDFDDDLSKKKAGNARKKLGVLWKKYKK